MKVGISTWQGRVSPVFDVARRLVLVEVGPGQELTRAEERIEQTHLSRRAERVARLGIDVLICGAISRPLEAMLVSAGVRVIPQTCGPVEDVLQAFVTGRLTEEAFLMPGCCGRRRRLRGGRRRGRP
jgi:predicted Fe-Mo cluster-binding NifX family protein